MTHVASSTYFDDRIEMSVDGTIKENALKNLDRFDDSIDQNSVFFNIELPAPPEQMLFTDDDVTITSPNPPDFYILISTVFVSRKGKQLIEDLGRAGYLFDLNYDVAPEVDLPLSHEMFQFYPKYEFHLRFEIDGRLLSPPFRNRADLVGCRFDIPWPKSDGIESLGHLARFNRTARKLVVSDNFVSEFKKRSLIGLSFSQAN